ncbi:MAG: alkaline phosphatase family protein [Acidobacteria bacterium]|nr:alkaline phosphatase family protein [Acidobacteriota bacterium]
MTLGSRIADRLLPCLQRDPVRRGSMPALLLAAFLFCFSAASPGPLPFAGRTEGSGGRNRVEQQAKPYVVLISLDGFRADYIDRASAPNLRTVIERGVRAEGLTPVFPSKTYPNHVSIVTGMYADRHGIVANHFYDPQRGATFTTRQRETIGDGSWYRGEPIWVSAEKQGMVTASFFWPGDEAAIAGIRPTHWRVFDSRTPRGEGISAALGWLRLPPDRRPHLITLYIGDLDDAGHDHGPASAHVLAAVETVDRELGRLLDGIESLALHEEVYLILVSDHGMAGVGPEYAMAWEDLIELKGIRCVDFGPIVSLHVDGGPGRAKSVRNSLNRRLRHGRAYLRDEVPARLHYRADPRIGDVLVIMEEPYQVVPAAGLARVRGGNHGWDPSSPSMQGIFIAMGPRLKRGVTIPRFENIHIYPLIAELLGLRVPSKIDGRRAGLVRQVLDRRPRARAK